MISVNFPVVLASGSPRRRELLREIFPDFEVLVSDVDEDALTLPDPFETAESLARAKALKVLQIRPDALVIGGDTVVAAPNSDGTYTQLAKPSTPEHAVEMLMSLTGRTHLVITGICLASRGRTLTATDCSKVTFREVTRDEIVEYVATGESMDKAGGYACQGGAKKFIDRIDGSISNVIGLPLEKLREVLKTL